MESLYYRAKHLKRDSTATLNRNYNTLKQRRERCNNHFALLKRIPVSFNVLKKLNHQTIIIYDYDLSKYSSMFINILEFNSAILIDFHKASLFFYISLTIQQYPYPI